MSPPPVFLRHCASVCFFSKNAASNKNNENDDSKYDNYSLALAWIRESIVL